MQEVPQQVICKPYPQALTDELNKAIRHGWRVIPGSIVIGPKNPDVFGEQQSMAIIYRESPTVPDPPATAAEAVHPSATALQSAVEKQLKMDRATSSPMNASLNDKPFSGPTNAERDVVLRRIRHR